MSDELETLAYGYGLIEGPRVDADDNLYFSDVPNGGVRRRSPDGAIEVVVPKRRGVGGIALHIDGGLVISGRNICHVNNGETRVLFETECLGLNDLMTDSAGRIICGTIRSDPFDTTAPRTVGEAYRINLDGTVETLYGDVRLTNGIGFSPAGDRMYHSDSASGHLICHDVVTPDGAGADGGEGPGGAEDRPPALVNRRPLKPKGPFSPDGLAVDEAGTIWVADFSAGAVIGLDETGETVGRIEVPANAVTSLCFGGHDRRDLYIVTADNTDEPDRGGTIFRTRVEVPGMTVAPARV